MVTRRNLTIAVVLTLLLSITAYAADEGNGTLDQSATPSESGGRMYSLKAIYNRLHSGTTAGKESGFTEPTAAPANYVMYTLNNLLDDFTGGAGGTGFNTDATACSGTLAAHVLAGKTFFATSGANRNVSWGPVTGTANTSPGSGTPAGAGQILSTYYAFNAAGAAMSGTASSGGLPRTGQITPTTPAGCDGDLKKGYPAYPAGQYTNTIGTTNSVTDNGTGLIWIKSHAAIGTVGGYNFAGTFYWSSAYGSPDAFSAIAALNASNYDGSSQWRLPNVKELQSIVNYNTYSPAIDTAYFTSQSLYYWSSTTYAYSTGNAWGVNFNVGFVSSFDKSSTYYVRPVRGG